VLRLSLRDDILRIPRLDESGAPLPDARRAALLRARLADTGLLDENGYLSIPFDTRLEDLSPATRNHKLRSVEADLNLSDAGDPVARLYLVQGGTNVLRSVEGERQYYRFPELTAVLNPSIGGVKIFAPEYYVNERLRDRPLVSTDWRLVINQRDERVNQDLNLQSVNDIVLLLYYTDFTEF
jgi:hypothetical protein